MQVHAVLLIVHNNNEHCDCIYCTGSATIVFLPVERKLPQNQAPKFMFWVSTGQSGVRQ